MSTSNTEYLKLYKNTKLYNGSRYQFYLTNREQAFLAFLGEPFYEATVYYKSLSEPIELKKTFEELDGVTYGSITNEDKTYYFFVDNIRTDSYKKTFMEYTIDWWTTNWSNINPTKAHITRQNRTKPGYMEQPISKYNMNIQHTPITDDFTIWATYIPSAEGSKSFISYIILEGNITNTNYVELGSWVDKLGIAGSDVKDCFIVPYFNYNFFAAGDQFYAVCSENYRGQTGVPSETEKDRIMMALSQNFYNPFPEYHDYVFDTSTGKYWLLVYEPGSTTALDLQATTYPSSTLLGRYITSSDAYGITGEFKMYMLPDRITSQTRRYSKSLTTTFVSTDKVKQGIMDWNGNSIWEAPNDNTTYEFNINLLLGISHIMLEFVPTSDEDNAQMLVGKSFCYDCRHPGLFVDSYKDYILKNREYDIEMRRIQSDKQETQAWFSAAENVGFGAAFGQVQGAAAAGIGGVIEAVGTHILNKTFDPRIQAQYDLRYARTTDQISLVGDSITNVLNALANNSGLLKKYSISVSTSSSDRYDSDLTTNGYYSDEITSNLKNWLAVGRIIQAENVVIEGACNVIGKQQVVERFMNGVEFI